MAKFTYRLTSVLNIKLQMEEQARMEFGQAAQNLRTEEERLEALYVRREECLEEGRKLRNEGIDILKIKENEQAIKVTDDLIIGQKERIKVAGRALERARVKLTEAMQERKAQEILKEKAFEAYLEEEKQAEAKEIDELVSYRYGAGDVKGNGNE